MASSSEAPLNESDFDNLLGCQRGASVGGGSDDGGRFDGGSSGGGFPPACSAQLEGADALAFHVLGLIGRGGSADVFLVVRDGHGSDVGTHYAMKRTHLARLSAARRQQLAEETAILRSLKHPFIVSLHDTIETERSLYLALTFAGGGDLTLWFSQLTPSRSRTIIAEVALALEYLHGQRIVYRDLKPENTLVGLDGHVLVADFGVSKRLHADTATLVGTPPYMAPEQWMRKPYSVEVDWWSLAVMLHELLTSDTIGECEHPKLRLDEIEDADARDLLARMLLVDRERRLGAGEHAAAAVKAHSYFGKSYFGTHIDFPALLRKECGGWLAMMAEVGEELTLPLSISDAEEKAEQSIVYVNAAFCALTGYERDELAGRSLRMLDGQRTEREAKRRIHAALAAGEALTVELTSYARTMRFGTHRLRVQPVFDARGVHVFTVALQIDLQTYAHRVQEFDRLAAALPPTTAAVGDGPRAAPLLHVRALVAMLPIVALVLLTACGYVWLEV